MRFLLLSTLFVYSLTLLSQNKADISFQININTDTVCPGEQVLVTTDISNGTPPYQFTLDDGTVVSPPFFVIPDSAYILRLTLTDADGATASEEAQINVYKLPDISPKSDITAGCQPLMVSFNDETAENYNKSYLWNFGDNGISQVKNPIYVYETDGIYKVTLTVKETHGNKTCINTDSLKNTIEVYKKPNYKFSPSPEVVKDI